MELYLDSNAHLSPSKIALEALSAFSRSKGGQGNPSSPAAPGRLASLAIEEAREQIASLLGAKEPGQIVFTHSCTQACEWACDLLFDLPTYGKNTYISPTEHSAINQPVQNTFCGKEDKLLELPIDSNGVIDINRDYYSNSVICIYVQNEIGIIQPIHKLQSKYLLSDFCQAPGKIKFNLSELPVDFATFSAHKFQGPGNLGFMYIKDSAHWKEFGTGSRYYRDRAGSMDAASIVATAAALKEAHDTFDGRQSKMLEFRDILENGLADMGVQVIAKDAERVPNTTFIKLGEGKGLEALIGLGEQGIHTALGSACSGLISKSPLMEKLCIPGNAHSFMRISQWGHYGKKEAQFLLDKIRKYV